MPHPPDWIGGQMYRSSRGGGGLGQAGIDRCTILTGFTSSIRPIQDFSPRNKLNTSILTLQWSVLLPCIRQQIKGEQSDEIRHSSFISSKPLAASKSHLCPLVRSVCTISSFYKAFEQFSSRSIELILKLLFSRRRSLLFFFFFFFWGFVFKARQFFYPCLTLRL